MSEYGLERALTDADGDLGLRPLPDLVVELLAAVAAPPRLAAHLRAVHDVAGQLLDWLAGRYPRVAVDGPAVLFGAATHDIGKAVHRAELSGPGSAHEREGYRLLLSYGVPDHLAAFARDHARWDGARAATVESLLVSLADKVWKGRREADLESQLVNRIAEATGESAWSVFAALDDALTAIADKADLRLAYQARHPID